MKIVADENISLIHEFFDSLGDVVTVSARELDREHVRDADILVVRSVVPIGRALLENTSVRFVGTCTAGIDHLDTEALDRLGIGWSAAPGCNASAVVDYVLSTFAALGLDFLNSTVGIIGCGNVGASLYRRLKGLGITCRCYDPFLNSEQQADLSELTQVLQSDIICIHAPLTIDSEHPSFHLLGMEQLELLKKGATLISAGRGGVIDNRALGNFLKQREDVKVVLDVWESEPEIDTELAETVTFGTPHIAGYSYDGKARGTEIIYRKVCEFLQRPATKTFANFDDFQPGEPIELRQTDHREALEEAILSVYDMRVDHENFKRALRREATPREAFDKLRKNYPMRREFFNYSLRLLQADEELGRKLAVAGFRVCT